MAERNNVYEIIDSGRSMVEMLGVLAIIGILSVGGIAGYSRAMMQYRTNKTMSQVSLIASSLRTLFGTKDNYTSLGSITNLTLLEKAKVIPEELINVSVGNDGNTTKKLKNAFKGEIAVTKSDLVKEGDDGAFIITYYYIPREACISMAARDWGSASSSGFVAMGVNYTDAEMKALLQGCSKSATASKAHACASVVGNGSTQEPLSLTEASNACSTALSNAISWKFY